MEGAWWAGFVVLKQILLRAEILQDRRKAVLKREDAMFASGWTGGIGNCSIEFGLRLG